MNHSKHPDQDPLDKLNKPNKGIILEFVDFARTHKKLWLIPLFLILILCGLLILIGGSTAAPFIYRLF